MPIFTQPSSPFNTNNFGPTSDNRQNLFQPTQGANPDSKSIFGTNQPNNIFEPNKNNMGQSIFANSGNASGLLSTEQNKNQIGSTNTQNQPSINNISKFTEPNSQLIPNMKNEDQKSSNLFSMNNQTAAPNLFNPSGPNTSIFSVPNLPQSFSFQSTQPNLNQNDSKEIKKELNPQVPQGNLFANSTQSNSANLFNPSNVNNNIFKNQNSLPSQNEEMKGGFQQKVSTNFANPSKEEKIQTNFFGGGSGGTNSFQAQKQGEDKQSQPNKPQNPGLIIIANNEEGIIDFKGGAGPGRKTKSEIKKDDLNLNKGKMQTSDNSDLSNINIPKDHDSQMQMFPSKTNENMNLFNQGVNPQGNMSGQFFSNSTNIFGKAEEKKQFKNVENKEEILTKNSQQNIFAGSSMNSTASFSQNSFQGSNARNIFTEVQKSEVSMNQLPSNLNIIQPNPSEFIDQSRRNILNQNTNKAIGNNEVQNNQASQKDIVEKQNIFQQQNLFIQEKQVDKTDQKPLFQNQSLQNASNNVLSGVTQKKEQQSLWNNSKGEVDLSTIKLAAENKHEPSSFLAQKASLNSVDMNLQGQSHFNIPSAINRSEMKQIDQEKKASNPSISEVRKDQFNPQKLSQNPSQSNKQTTMSITLVDDPSEGKNIQKNLFGGQNQPINTIPEKKEAGGNIFQNQVPTGTTKIDNINQQAPNLLATNISTSISQDSSQVKPNEEKKQEEFQIDSNLNENEKQELSNMSVLDIINKFKDNQIELKKQFDSNIDLIKENEMKCRTFFAKYSYIIYNVDRLENEFKNQEKYFNSLEEDGKKLDSNFEKIEKNLISELNNIRSNSGRDIEKSDFWMANQLMDETLLAKADLEKYYNGINNSSENEENTNFKSAKEVISKLEELESISENNIKSIENVLENLNV